MSPVIAKKSLRLVVNGKVANNEALRAAVAQQRGLGHGVEVRVTWEGGIARRFSSQPEEADVVAAVGGDGTVNEVLHGLMTLPAEAPPALAVIPLGTANDFARGCGVPLDPSQALALCVVGDPVAADVGQANNRWFINAASIGFGAAVTAKANTFLIGRYPGRILMRYVPCRSISTANLPSSSRFAMKRLRPRSG
jgi:diacylglycerol kinase family enzyme